MRALLVSLLMLLSGRDSDAQSSPAFRVIVDPANQTASVDRKFLADAFLKKTTRWGDGARIRPVDLPASSPVRRLFTQSVIGRSVAAVRNYWQQQVFSGRDVPPPELETDAAVVRWVLEHPGSVGYVSADADLGQARVLTVK